MVKRRFWLKRLEALWTKRSVVWLSGVRRAGKTSLCQTLPAVEYLDCELPRARRALEDPEAFLAGMKGKTVVLDEIHRLGNPSEVLKIAADHHPGTRVLATGSSTLGASAKFRDTLTGRKAELWLTPMTLADLEDFKATDLRHRLLQGGLPPFFLSPELPEKEFQEWMDAFWAKDIQELFRMERRSSFQRFLELLLAQSGGLFEATRFTAPCEVSRPTITNCRESGGPAWRSATGPTLRLRNSTSSGERGYDIQITSTTRLPSTFIFGSMPSPGEVLAAMKPCSRCGAPAAVLTVT